MILVDTSVWIEHFRRGDRALAHWLEEGLVLCHPFVIGELACGHLPSREQVLRDLSQMPQAVPAQHKEVMSLIERHELAGQGLGWVDVHLLASAMLSESGGFVTLDRRLAKAARQLGLHATIH